MKRTFFVLGFLVIGYLDLAAEVDPRSLYARSRPAVVLITTSNRSGFSIALGTGFAVSDGTKLVTNLHVIQGATTVKIKTADNREYEIKYVSAHDVAHDLAVLECPVRLPELSLSDDAPSVGDLIFTIGNPQGLEGSFSEGLVSGLRAIRRFKCLPDFRRGVAWKQRRTSIESERSGDCGNDVWHPYRPKI